MAESAAIAGARGALANEREGVARHRRRGRFWLVFALALVGTLAVVFRFAGGALLRDWAETTLNRELHEYSVRLPALRLDVIGLGLDLVGLSIRQEANPDPPVAYLDNVNLSVNWSALLHGEVVAVLAIDRPRLHIERTQLAEEATDEGDVEDKGWQDAVEAIYPLDINRFVVRNGSITYVDSAAAKPVAIDAVNFTATNIRNIRSPGQKYPSEVRLDARVFDSGRAHAEGKADFLARPYAAAAVDVSLEGVPLEKLDKLADLVDVRLRGGVLAAQGHVEYGPDEKNVYLRRVRVDDVTVDYVESPAQPPGEERRAELAADTADAFSENADTRIYLDLVEVRGSELGYRSAGADGYRLFVADADITLQDVLNRTPKKPSLLHATGRFMNSGPLSLEGRYRAGAKSPDFDIDLRIEQTQLTALNDVFRSYGNFDVNGGTFAFYSELTAKDGKLRGYMKPLFENMNVYDRSQDENKPLLRQAYEGVVGGAATILRNRRDDVAAKVNISGRLDDPNVSALQTVVSLVRNAFVRAVLPGFEEPPKK